MKKTKMAMLAEMKNHYENGGNIADFLTNGHKIETTAIDEEISYDIRAGADVKKI